MNTQELKEMIQAEKAKWLDILQIVQSNYDGYMIDCCLENLDRIKREHPEV